jgi:hypothetical protein
MITAEQASRLAIALRDIGLRDVAEKVVGGIADDAYCQWAASRVYGALYGDTIRGGIRGKVSRRLLDRMQDVGPDGWYTRENPFNGRDR